MDTVGLGVLPTEEVEVPFIVFAGRTSKRLGTDVARALGTSLEEPQIAEFSDGEPHYSVGDIDISGRHVVIVQSGSAEVGRNMFDLWGLAAGVQDLIDRGRKPASVTWVAGLFPFRRQERSTEPGEAVMARVMAEFVKTLPFSHVVLVEPHTPKLAEYLRPLTTIPIKARALQIIARVMAKFVKTLPFLNVVLVEPHTPKLAKYPRSLSVAVVDTIPIKARALRELFQQRGWVMSEAVVVTPDEGRNESTEQLARELGTGLIRFVDKGRTGYNNVQPGKVSGPMPSVEGRICIVNDDELDTGATSLGTGRELVRRGAVGLVIIVTHGVLSGNAAVNIRKSPVVLAVLIADTVYLSWEKRNKRISVFSTAPEIAAAIRSATGEYTGSPALQS